MNNVPAHIVEKLLQLSMSTDPYYIAAANRLKQEYKIYPYHDGTVTVLRPFKATLAPSVPASD